MNFARLKLSLFMDRKCHYSNNPESVYMKGLTASDLIDLNMEFNWEKDGIRHSDRYYASQMNSWRDAFPGTAVDTILKKSDFLKKKSVQIDPGEIIPDHDPDEIKTIPWSQVAVIDRKRLKSGRFYPQGMLSGLTGIFKTNMTPFRCIACDANGITADLNHPMAGIPLTIHLNIEKILKNKEERGGTCVDWVDLTLSGPGMQSRYNDRETDFFSNNAFKRNNDASDIQFYQVDRMVSHIDRQAHENLTDIYESVVFPGARILDLMASWESHLPESIEYRSIHGLGLNESELKNNPMLSSFSLQDLNEDPHLDFKDNTFDRVICSLSIEYLTDPIPVLRESARILKPGGLFVVSFSNRWFPEKAIHIWKDLHDFEKAGLVIEYFRKSKKFDPVSTISVRGYPRPFDDRYFPKLRVSDPVHSLIFKTGSEGQSL